MLTISIVVAAQKPPRGGTTSTTAAPNPAQRAQEILARARTAIGSTESWQQLHSFSVAARLRRHVRYLSVQGPDKVEAKETVLNGRVRIEAVLPERFWRRVSNSTLNGFNYSYTQVINGEQAWRNPAPLVTSHRDSRIYDVGDIERSFEFYAHDTRQQMAFYTIGWLLQLPPSFPAEFIHAGQVTVEARKYEAIAIRAPNGFHPTLLIDAETYLPFALTIAFSEAKRDIVIVEVASVSRQFIHETYVRARREREARRRPPQRRQLQWRFSDHQEVGGLKLAHRITTMVDGEVFEELLIPAFKLNREVDPKKFVGHPEIKFE